MATSHKKKKRARRHGIFNMIKKTHCWLKILYIEQKRKKINASEIRDF